MPPVHISTFKIRHYECDAYGHVNNANYLRYMQEAAFDASEAVGWGFARYEAAGYQWLAYETDIEYLQPLRYGDVLEVKTWVADWRRVRSLRMYEMRKAGESELVARGQTDWVFLDAKTGYPIAITPEIVAAYSDSEVVEQAQPRKRLPSAPPPPPGVFKHRRRVEWHDIDTAQHVNNAVYLTYLEECSVLAAEAHGWPLTRTRATGFAMIARQHHIEYRQAATLGEELEIATWASDVKTFSATRHYTITRTSDSKLLVVANTQWVWVDLVTGKPIRIPADFRADFAPNVATE